MIRRALCFLVALLLIAPLSPAQQPVPPESLPQGFILIVQDKSGLSSNESPLYLASNWGGWAPGDSNAKLTSRSDMRWQVILKPPAKDAPPFEFKFTRGSWEQCEVAADLSDIPNRTLLPIDSSKLAPGDQPRIELVIQKFSDQRPEAQAKKAADPYHTINASGTIKRLTVVGGTPGHVRDCLIWLPPGYDDPANADRRYPVLYMQDGQNLFELHEGTPGEWGVDETATALAAANKVDTPIIVGIPHAGPDRISEYLPVSGIGKLKAGGDRYVQFLLDEVVPRVERSFRTRPGAENRAIGGSSLGGLISLYAATRHPDVFGKVLAESPSLTLARRQVRMELFPPTTTWPKAIYLGMGEREGGNNDEWNRALLNEVRTLDATLAAAASAPAHMLVVDPETTHNEAAWARRFPAAYQFLFPPLEPH